MHNSNLKILALDLETTGLNSDKDKIIEIGWCLFDLDIDWEKYSSLVYYDGKLDKVVTELTGINEDDLSQAPVWDTLQGELKRVIDKADVIIGHNIKFDIQFLNKANFFLGDKLIWDSWQLAGMLIGKEKSFSLKALAEFIAWEYRAHRALDDAVAVAALYRYLVGDSLKRVSDAAINRILSKISNQWSYYLFFNQERNERWKNNIKIEKNFLNNKLIPVERDVDIVDAGEKVDLRTCDLKKVIDEWYNDDLAQLLVVNKRTWDWVRRQYNLNFIDQQNSYLCKQKLKSWLEKNHGDEINDGIYVKIVLRTDRGSWDGYINDIGWTPEEWSVVNDLRCGDNTLEHTDCYWRQKNISVKKRIATIAYHKENGENFDVLYYWSDKLLLEDAISEYSENKFKLDGWMVVLSKWHNCAKCKGDDFTKQNKDIIAKLEQDMSMWMGMFGLLVRAKGLERNSELAMDVTPALTNDLSWQGLAVASDKVAKSISACLMIDKKYCDFHRNWLAGILQVVDYFRSPTNKLAITVGWNSYRNNVNISVQMVDLEEILQKMFKNQQKIVLAGSWGTQIGYLENGELINRNLKINFEKIDKLLEITPISDELSWLNDTKTNLLVFGNRMKQKNWLKKYENNLRVKSMIRDLQSDDFSDKGLWVGTFYDLTEAATKSWKFDRICLESLPFDPPDILIQTYRAMYYGDDYFRAYKIPRMICKIRSVANLMTGSGEMLVMDKRFFDKKYYNLLEKL